MPGSSGNEGWGDSNLGGEEAAGADSTPGTAIQLERLDRVDIAGGVSPFLVENHELTNRPFIFSGTIMQVVTNRSQSIYYPPAPFRPSMPESLFTSSVNNGLTSSFTDLTLYDPDAWSWDFGDGTTSTQQNPTKAYTSEGRYVASLTASRVGGGTSIYSASLVVVYKDGPSAWYRPRSAGGYSALNLTAPNALYLCSETAGNLFPTIDTMGAGPLTASGGATLLYNQGISDWTASFVGLSSPTLGSRWDTASGSWAVADGESFALLGYLSFAASSSAKQLYGKGDGWGLEQISGKYRATLIGSTVTSSLDHSGLTSVHMVVIYRNATSDESGLVSDLESFTTIHDETARVGTCGIGDVEVGGNPCNMRINVFAVYKGSTAEQNWQAYINALKGQ